MSEPMIVRQGDVMLRRIAEIPDGAAVRSTRTQFLREDHRKRAQGQIVLALGETTGHAHVIERTKAREFVLGDRRFIEVKEPTDLGHVHLGKDGAPQTGEHAPIALDPGTYEVIQQRQYNPRAERGFEQVLD